MFKKSTGINKSLFCSIFFLLLLSYSISAKQSTPGFSLSPEDSIVYGASGGILVDSHGFLWIGTQNGVTKWLGEEVDHFTPENSGLKGRFITGLTESTDGNIWIASVDGGLSYYERSSDTIIHIEIIEKEMNEIGTWLGPNSLVQAGKHGLILVMPQNLSLYKNKSFELIRLSQESASEPISAVTYSQDRIWVAFGSTIAYYDFLTDESKYFHFSMPSVESLNIKINNILEIDGQLWIGTEDSGLFSFNIQTEQYSLLVPDIKIANMVYDNNDQRIWIVHNPDMGMSLYDLNEGVLNHFDSKSDAFAYLCMDDFGNIWTVSLGGRLYLVRENDFTLYTMEDGLASNDIRPIFQSSDNKIWIGTKTEMGLHFFDEKKERFIQIKDESINKPYIFYEDNKGNFWIGDLSGNLLLYDLNNLKVKQSYSLDARIGGILDNKDIKGGLWIATYDKGLILFNPEEGIVENYRTNPDDPSSISSNFLSQLFYQEETLWISTMNGLNKFNNKIAGFTRYNADKNDPRSISSNKILAMLPASNDKIWLSGENQGIDLFDTKTGTNENKYSHLGVSLRAVLPDDDKVLFGYSAEYGLFRFDPNTESHIFYGKEIGLPISYWLVSRCKTSDGDMWFGSEEGIVRFSPEDLIEQNENLGRVYVTALSRGGNKLHAETAPEILDSIELDWDQNYFEFSFRAENQEYDFNNMYRYKLEGVDLDWYEPGSTRRGRYSGLKGGSYLLRVSVKSTRGEWSSPEKEAQIQIIVNKPLWRKNWFIGLLILFFTILVSFITIAIFLLYRYLRLKKNVNRDNLTKLYNRHFVHDYINSQNRHFGLRNRNDDQVLILLIDLDHFKAVNDNYGHDTGDLVLKHFSETLQSVCRENDIISRWGGEEFLLLLHLETYKEGFAVCRRLQKKLHNNPLIMEDESKIVYTCSIGISKMSFNKNSESHFNNVVKLADYALYKSKEYGRDRWFYIEIDAENLLSENLSNDSIKELLDRGFAKLISEDTQ